MHLIAYLFSIFKTRPIWIIKKNFERLNAGHAESKDLTTSPKHKVVIRLYENLILPNFTFASKIYSS